MNLACILFGLMFLIGGFLFFSGKIHIRLKAWQNMPSEEKAKIKIIPLVRNIGEVIMLSGLIFLANGLIPDVKKHWFTVAMVSWLIIAGLDLFYIEKSHRYLN